MTLIEAEARYHKPTYTRQPIPLRLVLARRIATLTIDPPGWGESGHRRNKCLTSEDFKRCSQLAVDFLQGCKEIRVFILTS